MIHIITATPQMKYTDIKVLTTFFFSLNPHKAKPGVMKKTRMLETITNNTVAAFIFLQPFPN